MGIPIIIGFVNRTKEFRFGIALGKFIEVAKIPIDTKLYKRGERFVIRYSVDTERKTICEMQ